MSRSNLRSRKPLALVVALFLSFGTFAALAAGEARAEQLPDNQQRQSLAIDGEIAKNTDDQEAKSVDREVDRKPPAERPPAKSPPSETPPPVDSTPPTSRPEPVPPPEGPAPRPEPPGPRTEPMPWPPDRYGTEAPPVDYESVPELTTSESTALPAFRGTGPETAPETGTAPEGPSATIDPTSPPEPVYSDPAQAATPARVSKQPTSAPVALGESGAIPPRAEDKPPVPSQPAGVPTQPSRSTVGPKPALSASSMIRYSPPQVGASETLVRFEAAVSGAMQTLQSTAAAVLGSFTDDSSKPSPTEEESPLKDTPKPSFPLTPPVGGNSSSLWAGSGQASSGGGMAPLLLGVLASGLVLLRWDGRLARTLCEAPKPSSALLPALERPG